MIHVLVRSDVQREWLRKLSGLETAIKERAARVDESGLFPAENFSDLGKIGYTKTTLPHTHGGDGLTVYDMVLLQETLARFDGSTALCMGWHLSVIGELYEKKLWNDSSLDFLAKEVERGALLNRAVSEAQTGSPTRGGIPQTTAVKQGGKWIITGRKAFTSTSPILTYFLVSAWMEEKEAVGTFLLHRDTPGLWIDETWDSISLRGTGSHDLVLEQVAADDEQLVEQYQLPKKPELNGWLLHIPACYLGIAQAARDFAVHFANHHAPNSISGTISQLPNVQQLIGEMDLELMKVRHFLYGVADAYGDPARKGFLTTEIGAAKHAVTNTAIAVVDKAMRIAGLKSLQRNNPLQRYYRDVRAGLHNPPMDDATIRQIALAAIEQDREKSGKEA